MTADISNEELRKEIADILEDADLTVMSVKKIRLQIEGKFDIDLTSRRLEVDKLVMECLRGKQDEAKKTASEESKDGEEEEEDGFEEEEEEEGFEEEEEEVYEEEEEEGYEEEEEEVYEEEEEEGYEEEKKPLKRSTAKKAVNKCKRRSSDEEESASDDDASDEEYSSKKPKATPKKTGKPRKISNDELFDEITDILKDADLSTLTTKKIILQIEGKFDIDLSEREWEVDNIVLECLPINQDGTKKKKADISNEELRKEIIAILKDADLTTMSAKKLRLQIEEKFDMDFFHRKVELDKIAMEYLREK